MLKYLFHRKSAETVINAKSNRPFKKPTSNARLNQIRSKSYAAQSEPKISYAIHIYADWRNGRLNSSPTKSIERADIVDGVGNFTRCDLCDALCQFVNEVVRIDNQEFPPKTVKGLIFNIQMHLRKKRIGWRLFDPIDFIDLCNAVDNIMKERTAQVMGKVHQSDVITFGMEEILWQKNVLGEDTPIQLLFTVFYQMGLCCALRGGFEHTTLRRIGCESQFSIVHDEDGIECIRYIEDSLQKVNQGGLNDNNPGHGKEVFVYPSPNEK